MHRHIPAPRRALPAHAESYNPPPEYLLDSKEVPVDRQTSHHAQPLVSATNHAFILHSVFSDEGVEQAIGDAVEAQIHVPSDAALVPPQCARLQPLHTRALPALSGLVPGAAGHQDAGACYYTMRFTWSRRPETLLYYGCQPSIIFQLTISADDLIPRLPSPRDLQPFPTGEALVFRGHTQLVRSADFDPSGQYIVSGSDDSTVKGLFVYSPLLLPVASQQQTLVSQRPRATCFFYIQEQKY